MKLAERIFKRKDYYITSNFGWRTLNGKQNFHTGTDYGTHNQYWKQYALENGTVVDAGTGYKGGLYVIVRYPRLNKEVQHFHLHEIKVKKGQAVNENTVVGITGKTGMATGIHLHLGLRTPNGDWENPELYNYEPLILYKGVAKNENINQLQVIVDELRCRKTPSLKGKILGFAVKGEYFPILEEKQADGYKWVRIGVVWIATTDKWVKFLYAKAPELVEELQTTENKPENSEIATVKENATVEATNEENSVDEFFKIGKDAWYKIYLYEGETLIIRGYE